MAEKMEVTLARIEERIKTLFVRMDNHDLGWDANHISTYGISFSCTENKLTKK